MGLQIRKTVSSAVAVWLCLTVLPLGVTHAGEKLTPTKDKALLRLLVETSTGKPSAGTIVSVRDESGETLFLKVSDKDGLLGLLVPKGKTYTIKFISFSAKKKELIQKIAVPDKANFKFTVKLIYNPIYVSNFTLEGVFFDTGKATLKPSSYPNLRDLVDFMKAKDTTVIELSGHTDNVGDDEENRKLSEARAKSVKKYLVKKGIPEKRIVAIGYGESKPVDTNATPAGRRKNRRTEVKILKK